MFPRLGVADIERMRRFAAIERYAAGERLVTSGQLGAGMYVVLSGAVVVSQRDGLGHVVPIVRQEAGDFTGEVGTLSGRAALVDVVADSVVEVLLLRAAALRALIVAEADLGERIVRAL